MSRRTMLLVSTLMGSLGFLLGAVMGDVRPAFAQRIDAAFSAGTFQISAGNQNETWRVNTSTGETFHCVNGQAGVTCRRAEYK